LFGKGFGVSVRFDPQLGSGGDVAERGDEIVVPGFE
jgi:hypothetical protein